MNTIAVSIWWGMSPPATTRASIARPYPPVSTARPMIGHSLDASTGTGPSIKPQRPDSVTGCQDNGPDSGHAATCPFADNSVTYCHQCILFQQRSYFCGVRAYKNVIVYLFFNIEVGTESLEHLLVNGISLANDWPTLTKKWLNLLAISFPSLIKSPLYLNFELTGQYFRLLMLDLITFQDFFILALCCNIKSW